MRCAHYRSTMRVQVHVCVVYVAAATHSITIYPQTHFVDIKAKNVFGNSLCGCCGCLTQIQMIIASTTTTTSTSTMRKHKFVICSLVGACLCGCVTYELDSLRHTTHTHMETQSLKRIGECGGANLLRPLHLYRIRSAWEMETGAGPKRALRQPNQVSSKYTIQ